MRRNILKIYRTFPLDSIRAKLSYSKEDLPDQELRNLILNDRLDHEELESLSPLLHDITQLELVPIDKVKNLRTVINLFSYNRVSKWLNEPYLSFKEHVGNCCKKFNNNPMTVHRYKYLVTELKDLVKLVMEEL